MKVGDTYILKGDHEVVRRYRVTEKHDEFVKIKEVTKDAQGKEVLAFSAVTWTIATFNNYFIPEDGTATLPAPDKVKTETPKPEKPHAKGLFGSVSK